MSVVLTHVYSATNRGDHLLAALAADLIDQAVGERPTLVAVDGDGFESVGPAVTYGGRARSPRAAVRTALSSLSPRRAAELDLIEQADIVVGVGGAYLRADDRRHIATVTGVHLPQLVAAARRRRPWVMMPQSIGPLPRPLWAAIDRTLRHATELHVRDDVSFGRLRQLANARRTPDLAVLAIGAERAADPPVAATPGGPVLVQVRPLPGRDDWPDQLRDWLAATAHPVVAATQSTGGRQNDDSELGLTLWQAAPDDLAAVLAEAAPSVALCGRLHAALACIRAGVPTVHIAYERKSHGAYADLGLSRFLVPPTADGLRRADAIVAELAADPGPYWEALDAELPGLVAARDRLVDGVRACA